MEDLLQLYLDVAQGIGGEFEQIKSDTNCWSRLGLIPAIAACIIPQRQSYEYLEEEQQKVVFKLATEHKAELGIATEDLMSRAKVLQAAIDYGYKTLKRDAEQPNSARSRLAVVISAAAFRQSALAGHHDDFTAILSNLVSQMTNTLLDSSEKLSNVHNKLSEANERVSKSEMERRDEWQHRARLAEKQVAFIRRTLPAVYVPATEPELDAHYAAFLETLPKIPSNNAKPSSKPPSDLAYTLEGLQHPKAMPKLGKSASSLGRPLIMSSQIPIDESFDEEDEEKDEAVGYSSNENAKDYSMARSRMVSEGGLPSPIQKPYTPSSGTLPASKQASEAASSELGGEISSGDSTKVGVGSGDESKPLKISLPGPIDAVGRQ